MKSKIQNPKSKIFIVSKFSVILIIFLFIFPISVFAHQPRLIYNQEGEINIIDPELSQAFYDQLGGSQRVYSLNSDKEFELYLNLLVPASSNPSGRYSAKIYSEKLITEIDGQNFEWKEFYEEFGRDYYLRGPEFSQVVPAGEYRIEVYSDDNQGKYVLAVGKKEFYDLKALLNVYWQLPLLKITFLKTSVLQFFLTPFGIGLITLIGVILILWAVIYYLIGLIKKIIKHNQAKTLLLTSAGMLPMQDEIIKLLQKPAYDVTVAFITTASKPQEDLNYVRKDLEIMRDGLGFNVEEVDIDGKTEVQVMKLLELKDIIYVEGGNTFYLLKAMRECNFEKVIRKLLKWGKVYIGVSAGSMVAGRTIQTANWKRQDKNNVGLKNLKGLNLVPFDIFVHYQPEWAETIKQQMPDPKKRAKRLKILTDDQAILVQGKESYLIGEGEAVII